MLLLLVRTRMRMLRLQLLLLRMLLRMAKRGGQTLVEFVLLPLLPLPRLLLRGKKR
jgi:hypothetical protein